MAAVDIRPVLPLWSRIAAGKTPGLRSHFTPLREGWPHHGRPAWRVSAVLRPSARILLPRFRRCRVQPLGIRIPALAQRRCQRVGNKSATTLLHRRPEHRPIGPAGLALVRHPHTAGVDHSPVCHHRSNWTWVCPDTTRASSTPSSIGSTRATVDTAVTMSSSLRGEPWQKHTAPRPSMSIVTVVGNPASHATLPSPTRSRTHSLGSRSQFPAPR